MNPNDFVGYQQGQQSQQQMQMQNFNPAMQMQPNYGKGLPNFNPNMQINRQNSMGQFQPMQFQGMPNPMNPMPPNNMPNQIPPQMNPNMMKQHNNMIQGPGPSFGYPNQNQRHRPSLTGIPNQFNNSQPIFPQMIPPQSGSQPPINPLPQNPPPQAQNKKKRSSNSTIQLNVPNSNISSTGSNSNIPTNPSIQMAPSSSIENIPNIPNSNASITTPITAPIGDSNSEKPSGGPHRSSITKTITGSANQKHSMIPSQSSMTGIGSMSAMGSIGSIPPMNMSGIGSMSNIPPMGMNGIPPMKMNMNMPSMGMAMPMGMNVMNQMNMMNGMQSMNPMGSGMGIPAMPSMGNMSAMQSMGSMGNMNMPPMQSMQSMPGIPAANPASCMQPPPTAPTAQPPTNPANQIPTQPQPQPTAPTAPPQMPQPPQPVPTAAQNSIPSQIGQISQMGLIGNPGNLTPDLKKMISLLNGSKTTENQDKNDLFFNLFDFHQGKKREEKIKCFVEYVKKFHPSWVSIIVSFLEQICQPSPPLSSSMYVKFKNPRIPIVFQPAREKGVKPIFKNLFLNKNPLEFSPGKNFRKYIILGSFIAANETIGVAQNSVSVFYENNEIKPMKFGENGEPFYILFNESPKNPNKFFIQISSQSNAFPPSFLTWFVCQFVEKKKPAEVLNEILPNDLKNQNVQIAKTPQCKGCSFLVMNAIEEIMNNGAASCPTCHSNIVLSELIFDPAATAPQSQFVIEENKEMHIGRNAFSDALTGLMKPSHTERNWTSNLFDEPGLHKSEYVPVKYGNTPEYRDVLSSKFKNSH